MSVVPYLVIGDELEAVFFLVSAVYADSSWEMPVDVSVVDPFLWREAPV